MKKNKSQRVAAAARLWFMEGMTYAAIAEQLGVTRQAVWRWTQTEEWEEEIDRLKGGNGAGQGDSMADAAIAIGHRIGGTVDRTQARQIIGSMLEKKVSQMQRIEKIEDMILELIEGGTTDATMAAARFKADGTGGLFALMSRYGKDTLPMVRLLAELQASSSACLADGLQFDRFMEWLDAQEQIAD